MKHSMKITAGMLSLFILVAFVQVSVAQDADQVLTSEQIAQAKKAEREAFRAEAKMKREAFKERLDAIKDNAELSEEEKKNLFAEIKDERKAEREALRAEAKMKREALKERAVAIKENPNLTEEEKKTQLAELREERKAMGKKKGKGKKGGKGKKAERMGDKAKGGKSKMKDKAKHKINKGKAKTFESNFDQDRIDKSIKQLERVENNLAKSLKKEKITQAEYETRMAQIAEIKSSLTTALSTK